MTRPELINTINLVLEQGEELSTVVYAVFKRTHEIKQLNIVNDEIEHIQNLFIQSISTDILSVEEQTLVNVSEADDRANTIFEYDLELPESLEYFNSPLNDDIPIFAFNDDDLGNVESLLIEIGTEENQIVLLKQLSSVEVFGRGGYMLWKSNQQFERFQDKVLRITPKFNGLKINGTFIFTELKLLERTHGFHDVIVREANVSIELIQELNLLDTTDGLTALLSNISFARKVLKIRNSPVLRNNIPNRAIITFTKTHPALRNKMGYSEDDSQIILKTNVSKMLFIKMLDDAYLTSELTNQFYESKAKDAVSTEAEENVE
ncbi:anti-phage protein KwaB [Tenacibaculum singaporense]|uniref:anti-phage protein KwaB n=1 Tax=Tenacibaculum singaporense TaxID=2358479 RepID=UPI000F678CC4|nr:anti-phage protein KwaB [Tenacibaculum singaporense]RSC92589.1 DUF4868 domain-containing protein [Tenacibaculum singaporense]